MVRSELDSARHAFAALCPPSSALVRPFPLKVTIYASEYDSILRTHLVRDAAHNFDLISRKECSVLARYESSPSSPPH